MTSTLEHADGYALGEFVLLMPEDIPNRVLSHVAYAEVLTVSDSLVGARTRRTGGSPSQDVTFDARESRPARVPKAEFRGQRTGVWLREAVVTALNGVYRHGQVTGYATQPPTLSITTAGGEIAAPASDCTQIRPEVAMLLWQSALTTRECSLNELLIMHAEILGSMAPGSYREEEDWLTRVLHDHAPANEEQVVPWTNPLTGARADCSLRHVVAFTCCPDGSDLAPHAMILGAMFCDDPEMRMRPPTPDDDAQSPPPSDDGEDDEDGFQAFQHEVRACLPLPNAPRKKLAPSKSKTDQRVSFGNHTPEGGARSSDLRSRVSYGLDDAFCDPKPSKMDFLPCRRSALIFRALFASALHLATPTNALSDLIADQGLNFLPCPATMVRLYDFRFGIGGLSGRHFRPVNHEARRAWILSTPTDLSNFGTTAKLPDVDQITTMQDALDCYGNLAKFFTKYGTDVSVGACEAITAFLSQLNLTTTYSAAEMEIIVHHVDMSLQAFQAALTADLTHGGNTRAAALLRLHDDDRGFVKAMEAHLRASVLAMTTAQAKRKQKDSPTADAPQKKAKRDPKRREPTSPKMKDADVEDLLPVHKGRTICMRHLTKQGCWSKVPGECSNEARSHHVPTEPLHPKVILYLKKWGGLSTKNASLSG